MKGTFQSCHVLPSNKLSQPPITSGNQLLGHLPTTLDDDIHHGPTPPVGLHIPLRKGLHLPVRGETLDHPQHLEASHHVANDLIEAILGAELGIFGISTKNNQLLDSLEKKNKAHVFATISHKPSCFI